MFTKDESVRKVVIIADDLTGAADTGVQFAKQGLTTLVLIEGTHSVGAPVDAAQVLALNTNTRHSDRQQAYKIVYDVARVLKKKGVGYIYKKIDSMLRGNVGAEIEAVMDATGIKTALLAPCFPSQGRITVGGYHLVNQVPLQCTEAVHDLKSLLKEESYLPNLIQAQSKRKVGHVSLCIVIRGPYALKEALIEHQKGGDEIIVIDSVTQDHLSTIANAIVAMEMSAIAVGSAGLASELASFVNRNIPPQRPSACSPEGKTYKFRNIEKDKRGGMVRKGSSVVVICGTKSKASMQQIEKLGQELDVYTADVELEPILKDEHRFDEKIRVEVEKIKRSLSIGKNIVVKVKTPYTLDLHIYSGREQRSLTKAIERVFDEGH